LNLQYIFYIAGVHSLVQIAALSFIYDIDCG